MPRPVDIYRAARIKKKARSLGDLNDGEVSPTTQNIRLYPPMPSKSFGSSSKINQHMQRGYSEPNVQQQSHTKISLTTKIEPVTLYINPVSAPSRAVIMAAKHMNIPVKLKTVEWQRAKPKILVGNPYSTLPMLEDGKVLLWDAQVIMTYLANKFASDSLLYPRDIVERALVEQVMNFNSRVLYPAIFEFLFPQIFENKRTPMEKQSSTKKVLDHLESKLRTLSYVCGDNITLADLSILATVTMLELVDFHFPSFPKLYAWMKHLSRVLPYYHECNQPIYEYKRNHYGS